MLFIFLLPEQKKNETKRKFAVCIFLPTPVLFSAKEKELATAIRYAHRNSLLIFLIEVWSNSFFFLTLQKAPPLHGKKKRPDLDTFVGKPPTSTSEAMLSPPLEDRPLVEEREEFFALSREEEKAV